MENKYPLLKNWIKKMKNGSYDKPTNQNMISAGWFDWFCEIDELYKRMENFYNIFRDISIPSSMSNFRVSFKNCAPMEGDLYDYMYIEDTKADVQFIVEYKEQKWAMYMSLQGGEEVAKRFESITDLTNFFENYSLKNINEIYSEIMENKRKNEKEIKNKLDEYIDQTDFDASKIHSEEFLELLKHLSKIMNE